MGPDVLPALIVPLKAVVEFAAMLMLARAGIWVLCLGRARGNLVYEGLRFLTRPVEAIGRLVTAGRPGRAAVVLGGITLAVLWLALVWAKAAVHPHV